MEVKKNQLYQIPDITEALSRNPLKFILFIDDLSFSSNDNDFAALKAILEGSVNGHSGNFVVYATSNRRHLIKESWEDRSGSDLHESDTRQELMSLSARFGLTITFFRPDRNAISTSFTSWPPSTASTCRRNSSTSAPKPTHPQRRPQPARSQAVHRAHQVRHLTQKTRKTRCRGLFPGISGSALPSAFRRG